MIGLDLVIMAGSISATGFGILVWGSILLVLAAFGYIAWALVVGE